MSMLHLNVLFSKVSATSFSRIARLFRTHMLQDRILCLNCIYSVEHQSVHFFVSYPMQVYVC